MVHSTGAEGQLDRIKPTSFGSEEYARDFPKKNVTRNHFSNCLNMCSFMFYFLG